MDIEKLKNELVELMDHRSSLVARMQNFQEELNYVDGQIVKQKLKLADAILGVQQENRAKFVSVQFHPGGKTYDYLIDPAAEVEPGYYVSVETRHGHQQLVEVVKVFYDTPKDGVQYKWAEL